MDWQFWPSWRCSLLGFQLIVLLLEPSHSGYAFALDVSAPRAIIGRVSVQPIILSNDNGSNFAEMFGDSYQRGQIESLIDQIWAQAGIDIQFLVPNLWRNTTANLGGYALEELLTQGEEAGVSHVDPDVINAYFSEITAQDYDRGEYSVNGYAWIGANGITQAVGDNVVAEARGRELVARVMSHEIGHNLGLQHSLTMHNLMFAEGRGERLETSQIEIARSSHFVQEFDSLVLRAGDFDRNGVVDGVDFLVWQRALVHSSPLSVWQHDFGKASNAPLAADLSVVPEPVNSVLVLLLGLACASMRFPR